jgi:hypothetical protein
MRGKIAFVSILVLSAAGAGIFDWVQRSLAGAAVVTEALGHDVLCGRRPDIIFLESTGASRRGIRGVLADYPIRTSIPDNWRDSENAILISIGKVKRRSISEFEANAQVSSSLRGVGLGMKIMRAQLGWKSQGVISSGTGNVCPPK